MELVQYFTATVERLYGALEKSEPVPDSLITALLKAEVDGEQLTLDEIIRFCITLVVAGSETTTFLLGNLLYNLATMPEISFCPKDEMVPVCLKVAIARRS